ncbi:MAG: phosphodiester glycosidase family protein [Prevotella sp.]|nr:phosphodiester glycosidase family protein [Prevotella sp.]
MKNNFVFLCMMVYSAIGYAQHGTMIFDGVETPYEIRDDRRIGAGTKYTEYYFNDIGSHHYKMRALVVEIDNTNEYTYQTPYMAAYSKTQKYHQSNSKKEEFDYQSAHDRKPLAVVMGGGFTQDTSNPLSIRWEVGGGLISDGIMHYMPQSNATHYYVDSNGKVVIGTLTCQPKIKADNAGEYPIAGFNRLRSNYKNGITVFANGYGKQGSFQTADLEEARELGTEIVIDIDNSAVIASGVYSGKVVEKLSGSFNKFKEGQLVLSALQGKAEEYLQSLSVGEKVTLDFQYYDAEGKEVALQSALMAFSGYAVKGGVAQPSNVTGYPQDALGLSADGKTSYYVHLDNYNLDDDVSNAPIAIFNQFIQQIDGLYDAILMDGGPSSEMVVNGEWVSKSVGRQIPSAIMVYSTAKGGLIIDRTVSEVDFKDYCKTLSVGEEYTPEYYLFTQYQDIANTTTVPKDIVLSCDDNIGVISSDGKSFIATKGGKGKLYCTYKGRTDFMYIEVMGASAIRVEPKTYSGEMNDVIEAKLYAIKAEGEELIDNSLADWSTNNSETVVDCKDGRIVLNKPGHAEVYAEYEGLTDVMTIDVTTSIEWIEASAPVSITVSSDAVVIKANDSSVSSMSCVMYAVDGKIIGAASVKGSVLSLQHNGLKSLVLLQLQIDGKMYIYKFIN